MTPTLGLSPNVTTWILGNAPITTTLTGGNTAAGPDYLWESNSGTFANRFASSTVFTPNNATNTTTIIGRRVDHFGVGSTTNLAAHGSFGGMTKNAGSNTAWDAYTLFTTALPSANGFIEVDVLETNTEKAVGFLSSSTYRDPTTVNSDHNLTFALSWHMLSNGTAIPRKAGIALANPIIYNSGDRFRITVEPTKITFTINNVVYATSSLPTISAYYALMSFKTLGGVLDNPSYFRDVTNVDSASISVSGLFPVQPNYSYARDEDNNTLSSIAEDGSGVFRKKGRIKRTLSLQFNERPYSEYLLLADFWQSHERHKTFIYREFDFSQQYIMRFDTGVKYTVQAPDSVTFQVSLKEA